MNDYQQQALLTASTSFYGNRVTAMALRQGLRNFIDAANQLDKIKRALFYGAGDAIGMTNSVGAVTCGWALTELSEDFDGDPEANYRKAELLIHAIVGNAGEAGELAEALFTAIFSERPVDPLNVKEEAGDIKWHLALLAEVFGYAYGEEDEANIAKLRERFGKKFAEYDAINRNLGVERAALELEPDAPDLNLGALHVDPLGDLDDGVAFREGCVTEKI